MTPYEQLVKKLCECEAVREDMKDKTIYWLYSNKYGEFFKHRIFNSKEDALFFSQKQEWNTEDIVIEIPIESTLQERHLRMYCEEKMKWYYVDFQVNWIINIRKWETNWNIIQLKNSLDFHSQDPSVYTKILNFLENQVE